MRYVQFPVIDASATGANIVRLRKERGLTVRDIQEFFGFEEPRAIYKWQRGESLPTVDNLFALGALLGVAMEEILVPMNAEKNRKTTEQRAAARCSLFTGRLFGIRQSLQLPQPFYRPCLPRYRQSARTAGSADTIKKGKNRRTCYSDHRVMEK